MEDVLKISDLNVSFEVYGGEVYAVRHLSMDIHQGEVYALVGESGCGKSTVAHTVLRLNDLSLTNTQAESLELSNKDILNIPDCEMEEIRGEQVSMIFQDPVTALNPTMKIGKQIVERLYRRKKLTPEECQKEALRLLNLVQIPDAHIRYHQYPHQLSGGMKQRVMIAMALSCQPKLLIADEPTTALDVTTQAQILKIISDMQTEIGASVLLITHDFGVVASIANRVGVMYAGEIIEEGLVDEIFTYPHHPYTQSLMKCLPDLNNDGTLFNILGEPPDLYAPPIGCSFSKRCPHCMKICLKETAPLIKISATHYTRCWKEHKNFLDSKKAKEFIP